MPDQEERAVQDSVQLCLLYGGSVVATYEFSELGDANAFIVKMAALQQASGARITSNVQVCVSQAKPV